jgi:hypothetical protein
LEQGSRGRLTPVGVGLTALTLLALVLRLVGSNRGLWFDEILGVTRSFRSSTLEILTSFPGDFQHPLYSLMAHASIALFGEAPWSVRLPAILFGAATVAALFLLGREVADRREALFSSAFLAVSYHHVWYSQNARGYTTLAFLAVLATWLLIVGLRQRNWRALLAYGAVAALGAYTHLTMGFLIAGHATVLGVRALFAGDGSLRWRYGPLIVTTVGAALGSLLLYLPALPHVLDFFLSGPSPTRGLSTPGWAILEAFRVLRVGLGAGTLAGLAAAGAIFVAGLASYYRRDRLVFWLFVTPGIVTAAGALTVRGTMYPRFFFFMIGFGVLVLVRGAVVLGDSLGRRLQRRRPDLAPRTFGTAAALGLVLLSASSLPYNYRLPKQDYAGALEALDAARGPADGVVTAGWGAWPYQLYFERPFPRIESVEQLQEERARHPRLWLLYSQPRFLERSLPEVMASIRDECRDRQVFHGTVGGGDVVLCAFDRLPPASQEET